MRLFSKVLAVIVVLGVIGGAAYWRSSSSPKGTTPDTVIPRASALEIAGTDNAPAKEFHVKAQQFSFDHATIRVKRGDRVRLYLTSMDVGHGIAIPEFGVNLQAPTVGQEVSTEFIADKTGTFTFYCSIFCGAEHRHMTGMLIVE